MLTKGPAKKVTIFINEDTQHHMTALHDSIMTFLMHKGVSGATATRAYSGFGSHQMLHTPKVEVLAQHLPIRIEFVDTAEKVDEVLPTLYEMVIGRPDRGAGHHGGEARAQIAEARSPRSRTNASRDPPSCCACSWARPTSGTTRRSTTPS